MSPSELDLATLEWTRARQRLEVARSRQGYGTPLVREMLESAKADFEAACQRRAAARRPSDMQ